MTQYAYRVRLVSRPDGRRITVRVVAANSGEATEKALTTAEARSLQDPSALSVRRYSA